VNLKAGYKFKEVKKNLGFEKEIHQIRDLYDCLDIIFGIEELF